MIFIFQSDLVDHFLSAIPDGVDEIAKGETVVSPQFILLSIQSRVRKYLPIQGRNQVLPV